MTTTDARPARGTRPANRRALILAAAADLFHRRGYSTVSMKDIADAVAVGPSALYRHFRNKSDLLDAAVSEALTAVEALLDIAVDDPATDGLTALATLILDHRAIGALWHRETRHLPAAALTELRHQLRRIGAQLAELVRRNRSDLELEQTDFLAWSILAVATSVSFHTLDVPVELLTDLMGSVATADVPPLRAGDGDAQRSPQSWVPSRRAAILAAATNLFAAHGFADVGLGDIGAAVGIAGPSIYSHFTSKAEILTAAIVRGNEILRADMHRELARAIGPADALNRLATSYRNFVFENTDLIRVLTAETDQLPPDERHRARAAQHDYIAEWVQLLRQIHPETDPVHARTRIQAVLSLINDTATTPHLQTLGAAGEAVLAISTRLLEVDAGESARSAAFHASPVLNRAVR